jgi:hypothetical protein
MRLRKEFSGLERKMDELTRLVKGLNDTVASQAVNRQMLADHHARFAHMDQLHESIARKLKELEALRGDRSTNPEVG